MPSYKFLAYCFNILMFMLLASVNSMAAPYNTNVLIERGIDPQIINIAVTTFRQQVGYKMAVYYQKTIDGKTDSQDFNILFDPFATYGIDVRIQVPLDDMDKYDESDIRDELDKVMGLQSYLLKERLYDQDSLQIESTDDENTVISFRFSEGAIPRELIFYHDLKGYVHIKNNALEKIVLRNDKRFEHDGFEITLYEKTLYFTKVPMNGGYLLQRATVVVKGEDDGEEHEVNMKGEVVKYWNETKREIAWRGGAQKRLKSEEDEQYKTIYVDLDRTFPLLGQAARKQGYDLPKPFGISMVTMLQETTLHMNSFELDGTPIPPGLIGGDSSRYESNALATLVRADMWLLPFVNVGLIMGGVTSSTDVTLDVLSGFPIPGVGGEVELPAISTSSFIYGAGATIAGGAGNFFATVDMQHITSFTDDADLEIEMTIVTPIVGYNFQRYGVRVLAGAQYQDLTEELIARVDLNGDGMDNEIRVGLQSEKWATLIGVEKGFTRNWNGSIMYSQGDDRKSFNMMIGYRF